MVKMQFKFLFIFSLVQAGLSDIDIKQMLFKLKEKKLGVMLNVSSQFEPIRKLQIVV